MISIAIRLGSIKKLIINRIQKESFITTPLALVVNPMYIIRSGLYENILQYAPQLNGSILDFGCGSKPYESVFVNATSYIGVDIEDSGHNHANSKVDFFYDGKRLPFPDGSFDAVVCFEVFEHVFNINEVLFEIQRVLKKDGKLLITIPFAWDEHEVPYDFARYTSFGISNILMTGGFDVLGLKKTTTYFLAISQMLIAYLWQYVLLNKGFGGALSRLFIIFPMTIASLLLNKLLPKRYEYYCNSVILSSKR